MVTPSSEACTMRRNNALFLMLNIAAICFVVLLVRIVLIYYCNRALVCGGARDIAMCVSLAAISSATVSVIRGGEIYKRLGYIVYATTIILFFADILDINGVVGEHLRFRVGRSACVCCVERVNRFSLASVVIGVIGVFEKRAKRPWGHSGHSTSADSER